LITEFYGTPGIPNAGSSAFSSDDIALAFRVQQGTPEATWPWDDVTAQGNRLLTNLPPGLSSLNEGEWVEDEILENAMKYLVKLSGREGSVAVLESFIMRYSMEKSYDDNTFSR